MIWAIRRAGSCQTSGWSSLGCASDAQESDIQQPRGAFDKKQTHWFASFMRYLYQLKLYFFDLLNHCSIPLYLMIRLATCRFNKWSQRSKFDHQTISSSIYFRWLWEQKPILGNNFNQEFLTIFFLTVPRFWALGKETKCFQEDE